MRGSQEMYDLILGFAQKDRRVRAVILNGSRANPKAKKDPFQDYDIVYLVDEFESFMADHGWVSVFGQTLVQQLPDLGVYLYPDERPQPGSFGYLLQFADGTRLDLTLAEKAHFRPYCFDDRLSVVLLDKDGFLPALPPPDDSSHHIKKPCQAFFDECRCEFWWVSPYVAKGLWRGQPLYAQEHLANCLRPQLRHMLSWYAGFGRDFAISAGKCGDDLRAYLPADLWADYLRTYAPCDEEALWRALFAAAALFTRISALVAGQQGFALDDRWDRQVPQFLQYIKALDRKAEALTFQLKG